MALKRPKHKVFYKYFCLSLNIGTFISVFKDNKSLRSHKTVEIKDFSLFFASLWKDPDLKNNYRSGSGFGSVIMEAQELTSYRTDLDPEHCLDQEQGWSEVLSMSMYFVFFADKMSVGGAHTGSISAPPPDVQSQLENLLFKVLKLSLC